jgi:uncharacterized protein (TIGR03435 family)
MANRHDLAARVRALLDVQQPRGRAGAWVVGAVSCLAAALVIAVSPLRVVAQSPAPTSAQVQRFDVVSVRPCDPNAPRGGGGRGSLGLASPGRFRLDCMLTYALIKSAYVEFENGRQSRPSQRPLWDWAHADPTWIRSNDDRFTIEATAPEDTPVSVMRGPMLRAVLEERFKVKMRRETREVPVYELVVANGGSKLTPFQSGTCVPQHYGALNQPGLETGLPHCVNRTERRPDGSLDQVVDGMTLDDFIAQQNDFLAMNAEHPIVNRTGITGLLSFHWPLAGRMEDVAAKIRKELGLELRPGKAPVDVLTLEHIERPVSDAEAGAAALAPARQQFDVASVRPCGINAPPTGARGQGAGQASPGYLRLSCVTLRALINQAYAGDLLNKPPATTADGPQTIRGGPSWAYSETYTVEARAEGVTDPAVLAGPMLRSLLEDRFQLRTHRATEQQPVYALSVASGGLKIKPIAPGECWEYHPGDPPEDRPRDVTTCGVISGNGWGSVQGHGVKFGGSAPPRFVDWLFGVTHVMVIDKTGLDGRYDFTLEFTPDASTPGTNGRCGGNQGCMDSLAAMGMPDTRPSTFRSGATIFEALTRIGLKLEAVNAPAEYIVIDHAERPREEGDVRVSPGRAMPPAR